MSTRSVVQVGMLKSGELELQIEVAGIGSRSLCMHHTLRASALPRLIVQDWKWLRGHLFHMKMRVDGVRRFLWHH
jgi:hypothetical protein